MYQTLMALTVLYVPNAEGRYMSRSLLEAHPCQHMYTFVYRGEYTTAFVYVQPVYVHSASLTHHTIRSVSDVCEYRLPCTVRLEKRTLDSGGAVHVEVGGAAVERTMTNSKGFKDFWP